MLVKYVHSINGVSLPLCDRDDCAGCKSAHPNKFSVCRHPKWCLKGPVNGTVSTPACIDSNCIFNHFVTAEEYTRYRERGRNVNLNPFALYHYNAYMWWYQLTIDLIARGDHDAYRRNYWIVWYHYNIYRRARAETFPRAYAGAHATRKVSPIPPKNNPWNADYVPGKPSDITLGDFMDKK